MTGVQIGSLILRILLVMFVDVRGADFSSAPVGMYVFTGAIALSPQEMDSSSVYGDMARVLMDSRVDRLRNGSFTVGTAFVERGGRWSWALYGSGWGSRILDGR